MTARNEKKELNFVPLYDYVLLDPLDENTTAGGIQLPDGATLGDTKKSLCVKAGPGVHKDNGQFVPNPVRVGDYVYHMARAAPFKVVLNGHLYLCCSGRDCVAIEERKDT